MTSALRIVGASPLTTIQDTGRPGYARFGVPAGGAIDPEGLFAANALVGNAGGVGALEIISSGPSLVVEAQSVRVAFFGALASITVLGDAPGRMGRRVAPGQSLILLRGQIVKVGALTGSAVMYMAVEGGFAIEPVMGSVSTFPRGALGGVSGRRLHPGDVLPLNRDAASDRQESKLDLPVGWRRDRFRVVDGPQRDYFDNRAFEVFLGGEFVVGAARDRMGMRFEGAALRHNLGYNIVSDGIVPGSVQVPGDGFPIVLLRDHQTTGGYPKIATVITADLGALGRAPAGSRISFERVSLGVAARALRDMSDRLDEFARAVRPVAVREEDLDALLGSANLISGVSSAHV